jgi:hypothetical protein
MSLDADERAHPARPQLTGLSTQPHPTLPLTQVRLDRVVATHQRLHDHGHSTDRSHHEPEN